MVNKKKYYRIKYCSSNLLLSMKPASMYVAGEPDKKWHVWIPQSRTGIPKKRTTMSAFP